VLSGLNTQLIGTTQFIPNKRSFFPNNEFDFLNLTHQFKDKVDWNYSAFGKLWTYNLCYFDFLMQESITKEEGLLLITNFRENYSRIKDGLEPYPSSLRIMNCVKFINKHKLKNQELDALVYSDLRRLSNNLEYHLLGNHLLENAFALLIGSVYFSDKILFKKTENLLIKELDEQILADGGHFELSPMYHQLLLSRALDCICYLSNFKGFDVVFIEGFLIGKIQLMLGWLDEITFASGEIPMFNDSTFNIAPNSFELKEYASRLSIKPKGIKLKESGYRKRVNSDYEFLCDVGNIGPDYIPGHAHSDTFNFVVNYKNKPLIVDTGITTYEKNEIRQRERATSAHNTVIVNNIEQSEVWGGFRVGRRAYVSLLEEDENSICAEHNGYRGLNIKHKRNFSFKEGNVFIEDQLSKASKAKAFIHFDPEVKVTIDGDKVFGDFGVIKVSGFEKLALKKYNFAGGFNKKVEALVLEIEFTKVLMTEIQFS
jgi:hypothetical protein